MLKIILGDKDKEKYLNETNYVDFNDDMFNDEYKPEWFEDSFVRRVLETIDNIDIAKSSCVTFKNKITGDLHAHEKLSTGCKTVILLYKLPEYIYHARFGDNCTDFVEEIASKQDITIWAGYMHYFNFKYIDSIQYINYGITAHKPSDITNLAGRFRDDNFMSDMGNTDAINYDNITIDKLKELHPSLFEED